MLTHVLHYTDMDVRQIRNNLGMTQQEFATAIGVSMTTVNRWEMGHHKPSKLALAKIKEIAERLVGDNG